MSCLQETLFELGKMRDCGTGPKYWRECVVASRWCRSMGDFRRCSRRWIAQCACFLFPNTFSKAKQFAPEIRRVITFLHGFLPEYDQQEVDVVQERSLLINEVRRRARDNTMHGIVQVQTISPSAVGLTDELP